MPLYFFDVSNGTGNPDDAGRILPDLGSAQREALRIAAALVTDVAKDLSKPVGAGQSVVVQVRNGDGAFRSAIRLVFSVETG